MSSNLDSYFLITLESVEIPRSLDQIKLVESLLISHHILNPNGESNMQSLIELHISLFIIKTTLELYENDESFRSNFNVINNHIVLINKAFSIRLLCPYNKEFFPSQDILINFRYKLTPNDEDNRLVKTLSLCISGRSFDRFNLNKFYEHYRNSSTWFGSSDSLYIHPPLLRMDNCDPLLWIGLNRLIRMEILDYDVNYFLKTNWSFDNDISLEGYLLFFVNGKWSKTNPNDKTENNPERSNSLSLFKRLSSGVSERLTDFFHKE